MGKKITFIVPIVFLLLVGSVFAVTPIQWLKENQDQSGFWVFESPFGPNSDPIQTSFALIALSNDNSVNRSNAVQWLSTQVDPNSSTKMLAWGNCLSSGEEIALGAYALALSGESNLDMEKLEKNFSAIVKESNGGIRGWYLSGSTFTCADFIIPSSTDTSAYILAFADVIDVSNSSDYLFTLQNDDGSVDLTNASGTFWDFDGIAPTVASRTALFLIAQKKAGVSSSNPKIQDAIDFVKNSVNNQTACSITDSALIAWALSEYNVDEAGDAAYFVSKLQQSDGGFVDFKRSVYPVSNPLDTALAAIALDKADVHSNNIKCNPQLGVLTLNSTVGQNEAVDVSFPIGGPVKNAIINFTTPNGSSILTPEFVYPNYKITLTNTSVSGNYTVKAIVVSAYGQTFSASSTFEVKTATGSSCSVNEQCASGICLHNVCRPTNPFCGDSVCEGSETCSVCAKDCNACPAPSPSGGGGGGGGSYYPVQNTSNVTVTPNAINAVNTTPVVNNAPVNTTNTIVEPKIVINNTIAESLPVENTTAPPITGLAVSNGRSNPLKTGTMVAIGVVLAIVAVAFFFFQKRKEKVLDRYKLK